MSGYGIPLDASKLENGQNGPKERGCCSSNCLASAVVSDVGMTNAANALMQHGEAAGAVLY